MKYKNYKDRFFAFQKDCPIDREGNDGHLYNKLVDTVAVHFIAEIAQKDILLPDDLDFILDYLTKRQEYVDISLEGLVQQMVNDIREQSRNSIKLNRVFCPIELYTQLGSNLNINSNAVCKILGVTIIKTDLLKNIVLGLCLPRFEYTPSYKLVVKGKVQNV